MPLIVNRILSASEDVTRIESLYSTAIGIFHHDNDLISDLTTLKNFGLELVSYCHEYDVHPSIQANGFRGILEMGISLFKFGIKSFRYYDSDPPGVLLAESEFQDFKRVVRNFRLGVPYVKKMRSVSKKSHSVQLPADLMIDFLHDYMESDESREMIFTKAGNFDFGFTIAAVVTFDFAVKVLPKTPGLINKVRCLFSRKFRLQQTSIALKRLSVQTLREAVKDSWWMKTFLPWKVNGGQPIIKKEVFIPRQSRLRIYFDPISQEPKIMVKTNASSSSSSVENRDLIKCRLLSEGKGRKLLINVHGGGYVLGSMYNHEVYLRYFASQIPQLNVLSIEISLAPENKYPTQIQVSYFIF